MTTTDQTPAHRTHTTPPTNRVTYRAPDDSEDGVFEVRMPIATTGDVRNEGDDPLTRTELEGMATQIKSRTVGVFLDHGGTNLGGMERYSAVEKVGEWQDPEVQTQQDDGPSELVATARLMDPESLPSGVGDLRAALGSIKEQVKRDFSISASIGWREDDSYPGGNDLMEASIVGIGADPRTVSEDDGVAMVARAAVEAGANPDTLLSHVRDALTDTVGERELTPQQADQAIDLIDQFLDAQGDATVRNFEDWLWEIDDEEADDNAIHAARTALQEFYRANSPMDEPVEESFRAWISDKMSDTDSDSGEQNAGTTDDEQRSESKDEAEEFREFMREQTETQTEILRTLSDAIRQEDDDEDDDDEEDDEENEADDDEDEDDEQSAEDSDLAERISELEETLEDVRSGDTDVETPDTDTDTEQDATGTESGETTSTATKETWGRYTN